MKPINAPWAASATFANKPEAPALTAEMLQWHLSKLYDLWDKLEHANGKLTGEFHSFQAGTPVEEVEQWFETVNVRFDCAKVRKGIRLTPVTCRADRVPAYDRHGVQLCVGDYVRAQVLAGRYGRTKIVEGRVLESHLPYGQFGAKLDGQSSEVFLNAHFISGFDIGYMCNTDFEHGHETWCEIVLN